MDLAQQLAETLRRLRRDAELTQAEMAKILGVSQATFARIESGAQNVTLATLTRFCHALRSKPGDLFEPGRLKLPRRR